MEHLDAERDAPALDARDLLRLVRTHWRAITLITLLCTLLALGWTLIQPKIYSATASGLVVATGEQDLASALAGDNLAQSKAVSYESLATSRPVAEAVGYEGRIEWDTSKPDGTPRKLMDVTKLTEAGWTARIPLDEGLRSTVEWFREHQDGIRE